MAVELSVELRLAALEFVSSAVWVLVSVCSVIQANLCAPSCQWPSSLGGMDSKGMMACPPPTLNVQVSLATGFAAAVATGLAFKGSSRDAEVSLSSGGHFNPMVTLGMALSGYVPPRRALSFLAAQLLGGAASAALLLGVAPTRRCYEDALSAGSNGQAPWGSQVLLQAALGFLLVLMHLWTHERLMNMAMPVLVGFAYIAACLAGLQILGQDVPNPLRSWSLAVIGIRSWSSAGSCWLGTLCGSLTAVAVDLAIFECHRHEKARGGRRNDDDNSEDGSTEDGIQHDP